MRLITPSFTSAGMTLTAPLHPAPRRHAIGSTTSIWQPHASTLAAANDQRYFSVPKDDKVRILRRDVGDRARMVLSGRMADVCAALDRMSRAEAISCAR